MEWFPKYIHKQTHNIDGRKNGRKEPRREMSGNDKIKHFNIRQRGISIYNMIPIVALPAMVLWRLSVLEIMEGRNVGLDGCREHSANGRSVCEQKVTSPHTQQQSSVFGLNWTDRNRITSSAVAASAEWGYHRGRASPHSTALPWW